MQNATKEGAMIQQVDPILRNLVEMDNIELNIN